MRGRLMQNLHAFFVRCLRIHEQKVLANRAREQLRILRHKSDLFPQQIQIHAIRWNPVIKNLACFRSVQAHQKLHQR